MSAPAPVLAPDLVDGLRRLKLAAMRQLAPELLVTAKTQRWTPEELLRTLVEAEITARDASNARTRMKTAAFPVIKTIDEFDQSVSSIPKATLDYLSSLEWIGARENLCLVGPAGTGKDLEDFVASIKSVGILQPLVLTAPCSATTSSSSTRSASHPWTTPARNCCSASSPPPTNAEHSASPPTGRWSPGDDSSPNTPPPSAFSTGHCTTPTSSSPKATPTGCAKPEPKQAPA
jgi:hypothetical protein